VKESSEFLNNEFLNADDGDVSLEQYVTLLWSRKWLIISMVLLGAAVGLVLSQSIEPVYRTDAMVQVESNSSGLSLSGDMADLLSSESEVTTEIEILKSRMVLGEVVKAKGLRISAEPRRLPAVGYLATQFSLVLPKWAWLEPYARMEESIEVELIKPPVSTLNATFAVKKRSDNTYELTTPDGVQSSGTVGVPFTDEVSSTEFTITQLTGEIGREFTVNVASTLSAINSIRSSLQVSESGRKSGLIKVSMESHDPLFSKSVVDGLLESYVAQNIGRSAAEASRSYDFLVEKLPDVKQELAVAESELNNYRLQSDSIDINLETESFLNQIVALDTQVNELSLEETQLARLYTPNHPQYAALLEMKAQLSAKRDAISDSIKSLPDRQQEVLRKNRDVEVTQQIYVQLLNKAQELNVLKAGAVGNVRIIDEAAMLPGQVSPRPMLITPLSAILAGAMMALLLLVRSALSRQIDSPVQLEKMGLPVFATIPYSPGQHRLLRSNDRSKGILAKSFPTELSVEALRNLRTSLHFGMLEKSTGVVAITGPSPEIGKSFVTLNVGYLAAQAGARVLIVDADLRRGTLGRHFDLGRTAPGLSDILSASCEYDEAVHNVDVENLAGSRSGSTKSTGVVTKFENRRKLPVPLSIVGHDATVLDIPEELTYELGDGPADASNERVGELAVVPRGKHPPNPSELLMHYRYADFIKQMSKKYDLVLLDTPPVLAATDALITSKYADMTLAVVKHGDTSVGELEQVQKMFQQNQTAIAGVVLNNYDPRNNRYGASGETYGYQYDYK